MNNILLLFISVLVFIATFTVFVDNNYMITAIFAVFLLMQCYLGKINIWISILLGMLVSGYDAIAFYFTKNTHVGVPFKYKHVDIQLTQQPMWDILFLAIFNNMMILTYRIFNTSSRFQLSWFNLYYTFLLAILALISWIYFNYDHNLFTIVLSIIVLAYFYVVRIDLSAILATLIIFPIMEHIFISTSNVYVPPKTPGEIFIGEEPLYWFVYYFWWIIGVSFLYYFLAKKLPVALIGK